MNHNWNQESSGKKLLKGVFLDYIEKMEQF
jgi:hypothetical protein